jgi:DNA-directed RNA polymerase subunit beta
LKFFEGNPEAKKVIELTLAKDHAKTTDDAYIEIHKRLRDGDLATADNAREFIGGIFKADRYDLSPVGRFRFNKRFC